MSDVAKIARHLVLFVRADLVATMMLLKALAILHSLHQIQAVKDHLKVKFNISKRVLLEKKSYKNVKK